MELVVPILTRLVRGGRAAAYEVNKFLHAIDPLSVTTLRNLIGSMDLERTLTSRETITPGFARCSMTPPGSGASG
jgi:regulator of protease activity HflC (stomatin/prohibitin superfamily)